MTLVHWIDSPGSAPPALALRMRETIAGGDVRNGPSGEDAVSAAMTLLAAVLSDATGARTGAITLLAADAFMTYAFEDAAQSPEWIDLLAADAMLRIAATAERFG